MADTAHGRVAGGLWPPDRQRPHGPGLGLFAARRRVDRGGADRRCGASVVSVVAARRMPLARRTSALACRFGIRPRHEPRDAARGGIGPGAVSYEGRNARDRRRLDARPRDRRPAEKYRIPIARALGAVVLSNELRRISSCAGICPKVSPPSWKTA